MVEQNTFLNELKKLVGISSWGVTGGEGTGSVISIDLGTKIPRKKTVSNPHVSDLVREYKSLTGFILYCPWRVENSTEIIAGSHMPNNNDGMMVRNLNQLLGKTIIKVNCNEPAYDLTIEFSDNIKLLVHCSNIGIDNDECYTFHSAKGWFTVKYDGIIDFENNT